MMYNPAHPGEIIQEYMEGLGLTVTRLGRTPEDHAGQSVADDPWQDRRIGRDGGASFRGIRNFSRRVDQDAGQLRSGKGDAQPARQDCAIGGVRSCFIRPQPP